MKTVKWDIYKPGHKYAGKPFVVFSAIAISPNEHSGKPVKGKRVNQTISLCDTPDRKTNSIPRTQADNWAEMLNELRKLGVETTDIGADDIEGIFEVLQAEQPKFEFSTRGWTPAPTAAKPKPDEMTFVQYDGLVEGDWNVNPAAGTDDSSGSVEETAIPPGKATPTATTSSEEISNDGEEPDLVALAAMAADDQTARDTITAEAEKVGISTEQVAAADSWEQVVEMIVAALEGGDEVPADESAAAAPSHTVGGVFKYKILNTKTKKKVATDVEILTTDEAAQTATVKRLDDNKTVIGANKKALAIKWSELELLS